MKSLERLTIEGDSPVDEMNQTSSIEHPSTAGHEKPCANLGGPSPKAKYYLTTDSEQVPWGKGEKYSGEESEIVPETVCLQAVGGLWAIEQVYLFIVQSDRVPFA